MSRKYFDIFFREADEHLRSLQQGILVLEHQPDNRQLVHELLRNAHTIKGSARMLGIEGVSSIAHAMEDFLKELDTGGRSIDGSCINRLLNGCDAIAQINSALVNEKVLPFDLNGFLDSFRRGDFVPPKQVSPPEKLTGGETVRVKAETLDRFINLAGELILCRQRLEDRVATLRRIVKSLSTSPLLQDLRLIEHGLEDDVQSLENLAQQVYSDSLALRMLPFNSLVDGYQRTVRDLASSLGKEVTLEVHGGDVNFDRGLLDELKPVLLHIVNNAVVHGIELPIERVSSGKPTRGTIRFSVRHKGDQATISIRDDGRGVPTGLIKSKAVEMGMMGREMAEKMRDEDLLRLVLRHGFSTADSLNDLAGRGVGLDVVNTTLERIRGKLSLYSEPGKCFEVAFQLPLSLSLIQALLVSCCGDTYAVPMAYVQEVIRIRDADFHSDNGIDTISLQGDSIRVLSLAELLGYTNKAVLLEKGKLTAVVLGLMGERLACVVDFSFGDVEIVVKKLSGQISQAATFQGATILGDGNPALILDVYGIFAAAEATVRKTDRNSILERRVISSRGTILVVDDSITSRTIEQTILKANGYKVETAESGADALCKLAEGSFDLIISDLEMPGMDGYELIRTIRSQPAFQKLPVIVISSLNSDTDRRKVIEAGAQAHIVKGDFDQGLLLSVVQDLISRGEKSFTE